MTDPGPAPDPPAPAQAAGPAEGADLAARVEAERAGAEYWRDVARQRRVDAARVQRRPLVRVAVAVDRRTQSLQHAASARARRVAAAGRRAALVAAGIRHRTDLADRREALERKVAVVDLAAADEPVDLRKVLVLHLGPAPPVGDRPGVEVVAVDTSADLLTSIDETVALSGAELVCLLGPTAGPRSRSWLDRLVAPISGATVATVPLVVHPDRPWSAATPHDLLVRWVGLDLVLDDDAPVPVARGAGTAPDLAAAGSRVDAATGSCVVVDRRAWDAAGGLAGSRPVPAVAPAVGPTTKGPDDLDLAVADLSLRLGAQGGSVRSVPAAVVVDDRAVTAADLAGPLAPDGAGWRWLVDAHGPAMFRLATTGAGTAGAPASVAITTATPSRKIAHHSGDWHYAGLVADALRRAGHRVRLQTIEEADSPAGRACDVHLVLRGLEPVRRTPGQRHVLWVISHPEALDLAECDAADLVAVASSRYADHLRTRTDTPVEVLLQATEPRHFHPVTPEPQHRHPVTVVANSRGVRRAAVADALAAGLTPAVYGQGWRDLLDPALIASDYAAPDQLPAVYSSADVVLNDHWDTMRHWGFVSNRIFDVLACGTPVVSDHLPEIAELFGTLVPTWRSPAELATVVREMHADPSLTAERVADARRLVLDAHTFDQRVAELDALLRRHGPTIGGGPG